MPPFNGIKLHRVVAQVAGHGRSGNRASNGDGVSAFATYDRGTAIDFAANVNSVCTAVGLDYRSTDGTNDRDGVRTIQ